MAVVTTLYLFSIPFSIRAHRRLMNTLLAERSQMAAAEAAAADAKPLPGEEPERPLRPN